MGKTYQDVTNNTWVNTLKQAVNYKNNYLPTGMVNIKINKPGDVITSLTFLPH